MTYIKVVLELSEWELNIIIDSVKDHIQTLADEREDDWKYKDTDGYKAAGIDLKSLKDIREKLLILQESLNSEPCGNTSPDYPQICCGLPKDHLTWPDNKGFYHRRDHLVWHTDA